LKNVIIVAVIAAVSVVGCGGGGGGAAAPTLAAPTVTITAANQGTVARAVVEGGQAFGESQPFAVTGGTAAAAAGSTASTLHVGALQSVLRRGLAAAFVARKGATLASATRAAGVSPTTDPCAVSGSITTTLSDADGSRSVSNGDSLTIVFNQCQESSADVVDGAMVFTLSTVTSAASGDVQFTGGLAFVELIATSGARSTEIQGSVGVSAAIAATSFQLVLTVGADALTVATSAPGYLDTVVYEPAMQLTVTVSDGGVAQSDVTLNGSFSAASIGGRVLVATVQPLRQLDTDAYPSSGQVVVTGASGTHLRLTALNTSQVQLELDANGDGAYEGSGVFAWGTLAAN
jgi:hypothetical protein